MDWIQFQSGISMPMSSKKVEPLEVVPNSATNATEIIQSSREKVLPG